MSMKVTVSGNLGSVFGQILKRWPALNYGLLVHIGYRGRRSLYENYLKGQIIHLRVYRKDIAGRPTVNYAISKRHDSVKITSYPLNLYRPREVYNIAKSTVQSEIEISLRRYDERILQKRLEQIDRAVRK